MFTRPRTSLIQVSLIPVSLSFGTPSGLTGVPNDGLTQIFLAGRRMVTSASGRAADRCYR
ncbi:hypothetical protein FsymDg_4275 [Candidatus Protofrankia datiscae]|uniref:Uncharacterized protein n=1 Tax=Candidatus Protofrankia datiscae TaxID=2716812 RepID=F8AWB8_9ACTN|nr:hypothetical protein FsymDg_4275 [Candidatus Protofrankia datiscae]